ncbi:MAG TPA: universal stress protein [Acidobacteriaceae bacterium]|nr:universal stress protein [Acidobacteriaceae bacterium]
MALITNILFPVSFSPSCVAMGAYVRRASILLGAKVTLLHVVDPATFNALEMYMRSPADVTDDHLEAARERLEEFLHAEFSAADATRIVAAGDPAREIAATARNGFDLIMMPSHAGTFRRMLLGSTTAKVLNDANIPVETSRHAETIAPRPLEHREWLCAIGLGENSERLLDYAHRMAAQAGGHLRIIHAIEATGGAVPLQPDLAERIENEERGRAHERIEELQLQVGSQAAVHIAVGPVKEALLEAARQADADVLVMGRNPRPGAQERLRDLTYVVVRDSPCPVVSV